MTAGTQPAAYYVKRTTQASDAAKPAPWSHRL